MWLFNNKPKNNGIARVVQTQELEGVSYDKAIATTVLLEQKSKQVENPLEDPTRRNALKIAAVAGSNKWVSRKCQVN